ncbi:hypothetical protein A9267_11620 [Shewanella sp. UCD-FRSSP16_17]|uniref:hypothetical protein n=1 Tax=unclassified Shewanella TaxID=196818 RepID=UPI0007EEDFC8|nr:MULTISPECIES: hypothetical protein [unclassified Shewanella]MBQ4889590.1 hypothetical protein [Shewanella sp. MMG014]OBT08343.1 hypothetical protein A9267_11620 [Shewanella sp. UCD-FRSSP16_17]
MKITRYDTQSHQLNGSVINANYDRWTGRFTLTTDLIQNQKPINHSPPSAENQVLEPVNIKRVLGSKNIFLNPFSTMMFRLNGIDYLARVSWFVVWRSRIYQTKLAANTNQSTLSIEELLPRRHKRSIILCSYVAMITSIKLGMLLFVA